MIWLITGKTIWGRGVVYETLPSIRFFYKSKILLKVKSNDNNNNGNNKVPWLHTWNTKFLSSDFFLAFPVKVLALASCPSTKLLFSYTCLSCFGTSLNTCPPLIFTNFFHGARGSSWFYLSSSSCAGVKIVSSLCKWTNKLSLLVEC